MAASVRRPASRRRGALRRMLRMVAPFLFRKHPHPVLARARKPSAHRLRARGVPGRRKHKRVRRTRRTSRKHARAGIAAPVSSARRSGHTAGRERLRNTARRTRPARDLSTQFVAPTPPSESEEELRSEVEGWMGKVQRTGPTAAQERRGRIWPFLLSRITLHGLEKPPALPLTPTELQNDGFLKRTHMSEEAVREAMPGKGALEEFAAERDKHRTEEVVRSLSPQDLRKEAEQANEAQVRLAKEQEEKKKENEKEKEVKKKEEEKGKPAPKRTQQHLRSKNGLRQFVAALGHLGLGKERAHFVENLATMLKAGLPLTDSLRTLKLEARTRGMRTILQNIIDAVENGSPLWRAMEAQSFFSLHALALVRIGEEAGNLAENVEYLAVQEEKDHALKSKVKMAMIYPTIVLALLFIIIMGLGMFVLPNLISVLFSLDVELPLVTRLVILFTNVFTTYGSIAVPSAIGGFIGLIILAKFTPLRRVFQWMMFRIPGIGRLAREATIARFGVILGGLLKAGVPVIEAMQSLVEVTPVVAYRRLYEKMLDHITVGDSFQKSFSLIRGSDRLLPPSVQQLVITGEKSGSLADIMLKIADIYDRKAGETAQKLPIILEPLLLLFIGGLVGTIAFAIIVPIYSIVGNVGRG